MKPFKISGLPNFSSAAYFTLSRCEGNGVFFFLTEEDGDIELLFKIFSAIKTNFYPDGPEILKFDLDKNNRAQTAGMLYSGSPRPFLILSSPAALAAPIISKEAWEKKPFTVKQGERKSRTELLTAFTNLGFSRVPFVETQGEFAIRGSVLDFFNYGEAYPIRIYLSDEIESVKKFEISTQRTFDFLMETKVYPASAGEGRLTELQAEKTAFFYGSARTGEEENWKKIFLLENSVEAEKADFFENLKFNLDMSLLKKETERLKNLGFSVYIFGANYKETLKLEELFSENSFPKGLKLKIGEIEKGFINPSGKICLISSNEIFFRDYRDELKYSPKKLKSFKFADLNPGDFLVHEEYGIGKYLGIRKIFYTDHEEKKQEADCLEIEYARGDKLLVPLYEFKKVHKYVGSEGKSPKISHLDTNTWKEAKSRVKKEIEDIARDLLKLEALRNALKTKPLLHAGEMEKSFAEAFPYQETEDQLKAIAETLEDMEKNSPMNRVVVGDVGFGKTEVAMRAAARAVFNGKQAAVLCPTTILAEQHYRNFTKRFSGFPVNLKVISRLTPAGEAKKILAGMADGSVDLVIGTHKIIQTKTKFSSLGIVIIDEEHKFGVKDKEKLKEFSHDTHLLMLSATPIPRTLYQSLSSLRTMSVIESPPIGRLPVYTKVCPYDEDTLVKAVNAELKRGGQAYYVYNRVESIETKKARLSKLLPGVKIGVIHGQMGGEDIEKGMMDFLNKKTDLMLASTIIESGLDIPSVNTLFVENAHALGLAQLYQLRGRIGREKSKAYCYLFFPGWARKKNKTDSPPALSETAVKRLMALEEFSELGSGFRLAMRDLEIRGAGELLGTRQHGFINAIGLDMYIKLLNNEIGRLKGKVIEEEKEVSLDLKVPAYIPQDYLNDDMERLNYYKRLLNSEAEKIPLLLKELSDLSGQIPEPVKNLAEIITLRKKLAALKVRAVIQKDEKIEIFFSKGAVIKHSEVERWQRVFGPKLRFLKTSQGDGIEISCSEKPFRLLTLIFPEV